MSADQLSLNRYRDLCNQLESLKTILRTLRRQRARGLRNERLDEVRIQVIRDARKTLRSIWKWRKITG